MTNNPIVFERSGHPTVKLYDSRISIKAIDFSTFRDFAFDKIKDLDFFRPYDNTVFGFLYSVSQLGRRFRQTDNFVLRIKLKNGEHWDYETTPDFDKTFTVFVKMIQVR